VRRHTMHRVLAPSNSIPGPDAAVPQRKQKKKEKEKPKFYACRPRRFEKG
jgi:hypothetical protein